MAGVPVAVGVGLLTALTVWSFPPFGPSGPMSVGALRSPFFEITGLVPVGYTLLAFTLAAVSGLVLRSAVGAVALSVVLQIAVQLVLSIWVRAEYASPETTRFDVTEEYPVPPEYAIPDYALVDTGWLDAQGRELTYDEVFAAPCIQTTAECLRGIGVVGSFVRSHPTTRFWPFQVIESGILLALVAGVLGVGAWGLRHAFDRTTSATTATVPAGGRPARRRPVNSSTSAC